MSIRAKALAAVIAVLAAGLVVWAVATVPDAPKIVPQPDKKTMSYDGNTISEEKNGRKIWELTSEHIEVDVDTQDVTMQGITGHFYAEDGKVAELKAESGVYGGKSKDIKLTGGIVVTYSDGAILVSKEMEWKSQEEILTALGDVKSVREDLLITADKIESSDSFNKVKAVGHAHLEKNEEKAKAMAEELKKSGGKKDE
ncbi:MAG: LPS export ABC transporter periplasmic protein LptC [Selenomonas ruminantium]|nr:LPS export ABC transporter periplasmic protein LptC [Selenomonas ruminantium]